METDLSMSYQQKPYTSRLDQQAISALAHRFPQDHLHVIDLPYRFSSWAFDDPENAALWYDGPRLAGWAVMQSPFWCIDLACDPKAEESLIPRILDWAGVRARRILPTAYGRPAWFINVFPHQAGRIAALEAEQVCVETDYYRDAALLLYEAAGFRVIEEELFLWLPAVDRHIHQVFGSHLVSVRLSGPARILHGHILDLQLDELASGQIPETRLGHLTHVLRGNILVPQLDKLAGVQVREARLAHLAHVLRRNVLVHHFDQQPDCQVREARLAHLTDVLRSDVLGAHPDQVSEIQFPQAGLAHFPDVSSADILG